VGFGGYRESGFGREGGREGAYEYLKPKAWKKPAIPRQVKPPKRPPAPPEVDRTAKLYIGGRQARPDGGYSLEVKNLVGHIIGEAGDGNRKDIRDAVEAARKAEGWATVSQHGRAQILYYLAENLATRTAEFTQRIVDQCSTSRNDAKREVATSIDRLFAYGAWADKFEGRIHSPPIRGLALAVHEPMGVIGIICPDEFPLLGFVSGLAPAIAMGNRIVIVPSEAAPLSATDFYQVLETSDVPAGVVNIVTGRRAALTKTLAGHADVDAMWYFADKAGSELTERESVSNLKRTFVCHGRAIDWLDAASGEGGIFLRQAVQVKNIWIPYGE
jgi:aldehyde dehydrogenase (NAD+)